MVMIVLSIESDSKMTVLFTAASNILESQFHRRRSDRVIYTSAHMQYGRYKSKDVSVADTSFDGVLEHGHRCGYLKCSVIGVSKWASRTRER